MMTATHLSSRAVIRLSPESEDENAAAFLQGLVTNDVMGQLPVYAGLLSAQGKTMFDFLVWQDPSTDPGQAGDFLLDCDAAVADDLVKRLSLYRLRRKITIGRDESLAVHWSVAGDRGVLDPRFPALGRRWVAPADETDQPTDSAWLAHRLELGVAEGQNELGDILWLETNAAELNGVSFTKGCYIGQENTARMNWRQKINRRLLVVPLDKSNEKRRRAAYPLLGLAIDHLRTEDIDPGVAPEWMRPALTVAE